MGAQEAHTSRWPAGTWSWLSPPSSACTSGGQRGHNDCGEHLWNLFLDFADGWNLIVVHLLKSWSRKIINYTLCVGNLLFFLCFLVKFMSCKKLWWWFFIFILFPISYYFILFFLIDWPLSELVLTLFSTSNHINRPWISQLRVVLFCFLCIFFPLWGDGAIFVISFCTG